MKMARIANNVTVLEEEPVVVPKSLMMRELADSDKPREKAMSSADGVRCLSNSELLAVLLGTGTAGKSVLDMSRELLAVYGNSLSDLARTSVADLTRSCSGIGPAKAVTLLSAFELGIRARDEFSAEKKRVETSQDIFFLMRGRLERLIHEEFWIVLLNRKRELVREPVLVASGLRSRILVDVREVFRKVLEHGDVVWGVALVHNHPESGCRPSEEDDSLTDKIVSAAAIVGVCVVDHVIVCSNGTFYSYKDDNKL